MDMEALYGYPRPYLTDAELFALLGGSPDSRYGRIKRLLAQGKLHHIRRGLYLKPGPAKPHPYALAQFIYGPSYVSLESALSYHGLIPEAVRTTTSVCSKRSKVFDTPVGLFSFEHVPQLNFFTQVSVVREQGSQFLMAKPWKAMCDYVYVYKKDWTDMAPLFESLRIEEYALPKPSTEELQLLDEYYHHKRITEFLKGVEVWL